MDLFFIVFDLIGIIVAWGYFRCGVRSTGFITLLLSALTLIRKVIWLRWVGVVFVIFAAVTLVLFRTKLGAAFWKLFGRDQFGRKPEK